MAGINGGINKRQLTEDEERAQVDGQREYVSGVQRVTETKQDKENAVTNTQGIYQKSLGVTKYENLRKMVGLKDDQSFTDYYTRNNGNVPKGYEYDAKALLAEEKAKKYAAQYEAGEIGYADFLMSAYGKDIMKANGDDLTSTSYWYNRAKNGVYESPLDNDYYYEQVLNAAEEAWQASEWYSTIYNKTSNDLLSSYVTGVTLNTEQFSEVFAEATEAMSEYFNNNIELMNTYYKAGYLDANVFNPLIDTDNDGKWDYYYHLDGKLYAIEGSNGKGNKWAKAYYDDNGNIDRVVVDSWLGRDAFGEYANEFLGGIASFWGSLLDLGAMAGSGLAAAFDPNKSFADYYSGWEAIKNSTASVLLGGQGNVRDFEGAFGANENGDNTGRAIARGIGTIIPMIIMTVATFGAGGAGSAAAQAAGKSASTAASQGVTKGVGYAVTHGIKTVAKGTVKGISTGMKVLSGFRGGTPMITTHVARTLGLSAGKAAAMQAAERAVILAVKDMASTYAALDSRRRQLQYMHDEVDPSIEVYDDGYIWSKALTVGALNATISFALGANSSVGGATDRVSKYINEFTSKGKGLLNNTAASTGNWLTRIFTAGSLSTAGLFVNSAADVLENMLTMTNQAFFSQGPNGEQSYGNIFASNLINPQSFIMNSYIFLTDMGLPKAMQKVPILGKMGSNSLRDSALMAAVSESSGSVEKIKIVLQGNIDKALKDGNDAAVQAYQAMQKKFLNDLTLTEVEQDGKTYKLDQVGAQLYAMEQLDKAFGGVPLKNLDQNNVLKNYIGTDEYNQLLAIEQNNKSGTGPVSNILIQDMRKSLKTASLRVMAMDYNIINSLFNSQAEFNRDVFNGDQKVMFDKWWTSGVQHTYETIQGMLKNQNTAYQVANLGLEYEMSVAKRAGVNADDLASNEFTKFMTSDEYFSYESLDGKVERDANNPSDPGKITLGSLTTMLQDPKNIEAKKLLIRILGIESADDANPLYGASTFRLKTDNWNQLEQDENFMKFRTILDRLATGYAAKLNDGTYALEYDKPIFVKVVLKDEAGKDAEYYIIPNYGEYAGTMHRDIAGRLIQGMSVLAFSDDETKIKAALKVIGNARNADSAEQPISEEEAIKRGTALMLSYMDFSNKDDTKSVLPRARFLQLVDKDIITKDILNQTNNRNALNYLNTYQTIKEDIVPILQKLNDDVAKFGKGQLTEPQIDKLAAFVKQLKSPDFDKNVYNALKRDGIIGRGLDEFINKTPDFFGIGQDASQLFQAIQKLSPLDGLSEDEARATINAWLSSVGAYDNDYIQQRQRPLTLNIGEVVTGQYLAEKISATGFSIDETQQAALNTISQALNKLNFNSLTEYENAITALRNGEDHYLLNNFNNLLDAGIVTLRAWDIRNGTDYALDTKIDDDILRERLISILPTKEEVREAITINMVSKMLFKYDGDRTDKAKKLLSIKTPFSSRLSVYANTNEEFGQFLYDCSRILAPALKRSKNEFLEDLNANLQILVNDNGKPTEYLLKSFIGKVLDKTDGKDVIVFEKAMTKEEVFDATFNAWKLYNTDTVTLNGHRTVVVNLNELHGKVYQELMRKMEEWGYATAETSVKQNMPDVEKYARQAKTQEKYWAIYRQQTQTGILTFDLNNKDDTAAFNRMMSQLGMSGEEVIASHVSRIEGIYNMSNPTKAVEIPDVDIQGFKEYLSSVQSDKRIKQQSKPIDMKTAIDDLCYRFSYMDEDTILSRPKGLSRAASVIIDDRTTFDIGMQNYAQQSGIKQGVIAGNVQEFLYRCRNALQVNGNVDPKTLNTLKFLDIIYSASGYFNEPDTIKIIKQEHSTAALADSVVQRYKDNPMWNAVKDKDSNVVTFTLKNKTDGDKFIELVLGNMIYNENFVLEDAIPIQNWDDLIRNVPYPRDESNTEYSVNVGQTQAQAQTIISYMFPNMHFKMNREQLKEFFYKKPGYLKDISFDTGSVYDKAFANGEITIRDLLKLQADGNLVDDQGRENFFLKNYIEQLKMGIGISKKMRAAMGKDIAPLFGDANFRNTLANALNANHITSFNHLQSWLEDEKNINQLAATMVKYITTSQQRGNFVAEDLGIETISDGSYAETSGLANIPLRYNTGSITQEEMVEVLRAGLGKLQDYTLTRTSEDIDGINIEDHDPQAKLLQIIRFEDGKAYIDVDMLSSLTVSDVELLEKLYGKFAKTKKGFYETALGKKIKEQEQYEKFPTEKRLGIGNQRNATARINDTAFDTPENVKILTEHAINRLKNKRVKSMLKVSSLSSGYEISEDLLRHNIRKLDETAMLANSNYASTIAINTNNKMAYGAMEWSKITLAEALLNYKRPGHEDQDGGYLLPAGLDENDRRKLAYEVAEAVALYSTGADYSAEYGRYLFIDTNAPEGKRVKVYGSNDAGLFKNVVLDNDGYSIFMTNVDERNGGKIILDVSKNALLNTHGALDNTIRFADLNDRTTRDRFAQAVTNHAVIEYFNKYPYAEGQLKPEIEHIIAAIYAQRQNTYDKNRSLFDTVKKVKPNLPDEVIRSILPSVIKSSAATPDYNLREQATNDYMAYNAMMYGTEADPNNREMERLNDATVFGINRDALDDEMKIALANIRERQELSNEERELYNTLFKNSFKDADGNIIRSVMSEINDTKIKALVDALPDKKKSIANIIAYMVINRQRGKDLNALLMGKSLKEVIANYFNSKTASIDDYTNEIVLDETSGASVPISKLLNQGFTVFDVESFYKDNDEQHKNSAVYQISFADYDKITDYNSFVKNGTFDSSSLKPRITTIYIRQNLEGRVAYKDTVGAEYYYTADNKTIADYFDILKKYKNDGLVEDLSSENKSVYIFSTYDDANAFIHSDAFNNSGLLMGYNSSNYDIPVLKDRSIDINSLGFHVDIQQQIVREAYSSINAAPRKDALDYFRDKWNIKTKGAHNADEDITFTTEVMLRHLAGLQNTKVMQATLGEDFIKIGKTLMPNAIDWDNKEQVIDFFKDDNNIISTMTKDMLSNLPKAQRDYVANYHTYGDNFDSSQLQEIIRTYNETLLHREHIMNNKKYSTLVEQISNYRDNLFIEHFTDKKNSDNLAKLIEAISIKLNPINYPNGGGNERISKDGLTGTLADVANLITSAAYLDKKSGGDETIRNFLTKSTEEQIRLINVAIQDKIKKGDVKYNSFGELTAEEVYHTDARNLIGEIDIAANNTSIGTNGEVQPNVLSAISKRLSRNASLKQYANTMSNIAAKAFSDKMSSTFQDYLMNGFATMYGKHNDTTQSRQDAYVISSAIADDIWDMVLEDKNYNFSKARLYDTVTAVTPGKNIILDDIDPATGLHKVEKARAGTVYMSKTMFKRFYGLEYTDILNAVRDDPNDTDIYTMAYRMPGFREGVIHNVRIKIVHDSVGVNTLSMTPDYHLALFSGDMDGDKTFLMLPTAMTHAYSKSMHKVETQGWDILTGVDGKDGIYDYMYRVSGENLDKIFNPALAKKASTEMAQAFKDAFDYLNDNHTEEDKAQYLAYLKNSFEEKYLELKGSGESREDAKKELKVLWKQYGISSFIDRDTNATDGGLKFFSYNPIIRGYKNNTINQLNKAAGGYIFYDILALNSSAPGYQQKLQTMVKSYAAGAPEKIFSYSPIILGELSTSRLQAAMNDDPTRESMVNYVLDFVPQMVNKDNAEAVQQLLADARTTGEAELLITAIQVIELDRHTSEANGNLIKEAISKIDQNPKYEQERAKLNRTIFAVKSRMGDTEFNNALKNEGLSEIPTDYFGMLEYRVKLLNLANLYRDEIKFASAGDEDMRSILTAQWLGMAHKANDSVIRVYDALGKQWNSGVTDNQAWAGGTEFRILLDDTMHSEEDSFYMTQKIRKSSKTNIIQIKTIDVPSGRSLSEEAEHAFNTGKPVPAGTRLTNEVNAPSYPYEVKIIGETENGYLIQRTTKLGDTNGGWKLCMPGSGALKGTIAPGTVALPKGVDADFVVSQKIFSTLKDSPNVQYKEEQVVANGKTYTVLKATLALAETTSGWNKDVKVSDLDNITITNSSGDAASMLAIGNEMVYLKDSNIVYDTTQLAEAKQLLKSMRMNTYSEVNSKALYNTLILYYLLDGVDDKTYRQRFNLSDKADIQNHKENYVMTQAKATGFGGAYGAGCISNILGTCYDDVTLKNYKAKIEKDPFLRLLFSEELRNKYSKFTPVSSGVKKDLYTHKTKGIYDLSDVYFNRSGKPVGQTMDENAIKTNFTSDTGYISGDDGYFSMINFINFLNKGLTKKGNYIPYLSSRAVQSLIDSDTNVLNIPNMIRGNIGSGFKPMEETRAFIAPESRVTLSAQKTKTANTEVKEQSGSEAYDAFGLSQLYNTLCENSIRDYDDSASLTNYSKTFRSDYGNDYKAPKLQEGKRGTSTDRAMKYIISAIAPAKTKAGRAAYLSDKRDVIVNTANRAAAVINNEINATYDNVNVKRMAADDAQKYLNQSTGNYYFFARFDRDKAKITDTLNQIQKLKTISGERQFTIKGESKQDINEAALNKGISDTREIVGQDYKFDDSEFREHYEDFFSKQKMYEEFVAEISKNQTKDTEVERIASTWAKYAGEETYEMDRSWFKSSGIKAATESGKEQAEAIDRMVVAVKGEGRMYFNTTLGDEYVMLDNLISQSPEAMENFKRYSYLKTAVDKLNYIIENEKHLSDIKFSSRNGKTSYADILEAFKRDVGDIEAANKFIQSYEQSHKQIIYAYTKLNERVQNLSDVYSKLTNQPMSNLFWFMIPPKERSKARKGDIIQNYYMGNQRIDYNLKNATLTTEGQVDISKAYQNYDYMGAIASSVSDLSKVMSIISMSNKMRKTGVINNASITDIVQRRLDELITDELTSVGARGIDSDDYQDYKLFSASVNDIMELRPAEEMNYTMTVGERYAKLYMSMVEWCNDVDDKFKGRSYSDLYSMLLSAKTKEEQMTIENILKVKSAMQDIVVKVSQIQDKNQKDLKEKRQNIFTKIYEEVIAKAKDKGQVLVDKYGRKIDVENGKDWYSLSQNSMEHYVPMYRYNCDYEGGSKANAVLDMINGDLYLMDEMVANTLLKSTFTRVQPGVVKETINAFKNISTKLIMSSPIKLLSRLFNFTITDIGFAMQVDTGVGLSLADATRELKAWKQSNGKTMTDDLRAYMTLVGSDNGMFYGEEVGRSKRHDPISEYFNFTNDAFNLQSMYIRYALFKKLSKKYSKYTDVGADIPAHLLGPSYRDADSINRLTGTEDAMPPNGVGVSKAQVIAAKIVSDTFGNIGDMPYAASRLSQMGFAFTTFPLALVRFGLNEISSTALAVRDAFTFNRYGNSKDAAKYLVHQLGSVLGVYVLNIFLQLITDPDKREALTDKFSGEELTEEQEEELNHLLFQDDGAVAPFESMLLNETKRNKSMFVNPYSNLLDMFYNPFANANKGLNSSGYESNTNKFALGLLNFFNTNIYSHLPQIMTSVVDSTKAAQKLGIGYSYNNDDYTWIENYSRRLAGYALGSDVSTAFIDAWKTSGYEENASFLNRLKSGIQRAFVEELSNSQQYKSSWKNYRKAFNIIYDYKTLTENTNEYSTTNTYTDTGYGDLASKLRMAMKNGSSPMAFYEIIDEARQNGVDIATIRSAVNNCSLKYKINNLSDTDGFMSSLNDSELNTIKSALAYENALFPFLDEYIDDLTDEYNKLRATSGYRNNYNYNQLNRYYNGEFHTLPDGYTGGYAYSGYNNNRNYYNFNNYFRGGYGQSYSNPFEEYRNSRQRMDYAKQQLEYQKRQDSYKDYNYKLPGEE